MYARSETVEKQRVYNLVNQQILRPLKNIPYQDNKSILSMQHSRVNRIGIKTAAQQ